MEFAIRLFLYASTGLVLVVANLLFVRTVYREFLSTDYVIAPFTVIDPSGGATAEKTGLALAQMMAARLSHIQGQLKALQTAVQEPQTAGDVGNLSVTTLFVPRAVIIPTTLLEPVNIKATVAGVEVGGIISWLQRTLSSERAIALTTSERADKVIISADLSNLTPGERLWFESDKHPNEIATNAAYAILQLRFTEKQPGPIQALDLADFRNLLETIFLVEGLNRRVAQGHLVEADFVNLLPKMEKLLEKVPQWPELMYLTASIADGAHNSGKAIYYYRQIQNLSPAEKAKADARLGRGADKRLVDLGAGSAPSSSESEERFIKTSHEFARKMGLSGRDPQIAFVPRQDDFQAVWNTHKEQYDVNLKYVDTLGLPQYVALMGRFFERNYKKCFETGGAKVEVNFWQEFRFSLVDYLIQTQPEFKNVVTVGQSFALFATMQSLEKLAGADATKRMAIELLDRFNCDWNRANLRDQMIKINSERGFMPAEAIAKVVSTPATGAAPRKGRRSKGGKAAEDEAAQSGDAG